MSTQTVTIDEITKSFTFPTLPKQSGLPVYKPIVAIHAKLKINAMSIPTTLGGSQHGHLGLVLPPATYLTVANVPFVHCLKLHLHPTICNFLSLEAQETSTCASALLYLLFGITPKLPSPPPPSTGACTEPCC